MPRDGGGVYTLPAGNPVAPGTVINVVWANPTMEDIGNEITNSLDRNGRGGMLVPFANFDGTIVAPGITFTSQPSAGLSKEQTDVVVMSINSNQTTQWINAGGSPAGAQSPFEIWNGLIWQPPVTPDYVGDVTITGELLIVGGAGSGSNPNNAARDIAINSDANAGFSILSGTGLIAQIRLGDGADPGKVRFQSLGDGSLSILMTTAAAINIDANRNIVMPNGTLTVGPGSDVIQSAISGTNSIINMGFGGTSAISLFFARASNLLSVFSEVNGGGGDLFSINRGTGLVTVTNAFAATGGITVTGTGGVVISGTQPALPGVGTAQVFGNTTHGGVLRGAGNTNDVVLQNASGFNVLENPAGTRNLAMYGLFQITATNPQLNIRPGVDGQVQQILFLNSVGNSRAAIVASVVGVTSSLTFKTGAYIDAMIIDTDRNIIAVDGDLIVQTGNLFAGGFAAFGPSADPANAPVTIAYGNTDVTRAVGGRNIAISGILALTSSGRSQFVVEFANQFMSLNDSAGYQVIYPFTDALDYYAFRAARGATLEDVFSVTMRGAGYFAAGVVVESAQVDVATFTSSIASADIVIASDSGANASRLRSSAFGFAILPAAGVASITLGDFAINDGNLLGTSLNTNFNLIMSGNGGVSTAIVSQVNGMLIQSGGATTMTLDDSQNVTVPNGSVTVGDSIAIPPAGSGGIGGVAAQGLQVIGNGTVNDVVLLNSEGDIACRVPHEDTGIIVPGNITAAGNIVAFSDVRLKDNLTPIESALDKIEKLVGYTYDKDGARCAGLIANDVQKVLPEAVGELDGYLTLNDASLTGLIINALNELRGEIHANP